MTMLLAAAIAVAAQATAGPVDVRHTTAPDGGRTQIHRLIIDAPVHEVWVAVTTPAGWQRWAAKIAWTRAGRPDVIETSYDPQAKPGGPQTIVQQFFDEKPERSIAFRTTKAPRGFEGFETYAKVVNRFELRPLAQSRTEVRFTAGPFPNSADGKRLYAFFERGNRETLAHLVKVLESATQQAPVSVQR